MFASRITKEIALPSDPSVCVTIRKLGWLQRKAAQQIAQLEAAKGLVEMGGAAFVRAFEELRHDRGEVVAAQLADPLTTHDQLTVLVSGVKAWTKADPITKDTLSDLEDADAEFLAREILTLTIPRDDAPGDREKNAVSPSTSI